METTIKSGWIETDPDQKQFGRKLKDKIYEFKQDGILMAIDLNKYSKESMYDLVCSYYGYADFEKFLTTEDGLWIIAECIFEQESGLY